MEPRQAAKNCEDKTGKSCLVSGKKCGELAKRLFMFTYLII